MRQVVMTQSLQDMVDEMQPVDSMANHVVVNESELYLLVVDTDHNLLFIANSVDSMANHIVVNESELYLHLLVVDTDHIIPS